MQVYRIGKCNYIDDLSGNGAALYGGRWNSVGTKVLYTANSAALAMLEALVNLPNFKILDPYCLLIIEIPENSTKEMAIKDLPSGWNAMPSPEGLKALGDAFIRERKYVALKVPSAVMPLEVNYLLNPLHSEFSAIKIIKRDTIEFDKRLLK